MTDQRLGIRLVGAGNTLKRHAPAHRGFPNLARLKAIADIDTKRAEEAKKRYGFDVSYTDSARAIKKVLRGFGVTAGKVHMAASGRRSPIEVSV